MTFDSFYHTKHLRFVLEGLSVSLLIIGDFSSLKLRSMRIFLARWNRQRARTACGMLPLLLATHSYSPGAGEKPAEAKV